MKHTFLVKNLDKDITMSFNARTAYEAMEKLLYTLNLKRVDPDAVIETSCTGRHLWLEHCGETWGCRNI